MAGESSAERSETVRETSGWQGKFIAKRHKCDKARTPTMKCVLPEEESFVAWKVATLYSMMTCDKPRVRLLSSNVFQSVGDFKMDEILSIPRKAK